MEGYRDLAHDLGSSFAVRVRGVVSPELVLLSDRGEPFGSVRANEGGGADVRVGDLSATVAPSPGGGYEMTAGGVEILTAEPESSATNLRIASGDRTYGASISPLRNNAVARKPDGEEVARVSGGLAGRRYEATFDPEDSASLPIAIFLLRHLTHLRSRAYRT